MKVFLELGYEWIEAGSEAAWFAALKSAGVVIERVSRGEYVIDATAIMPAVASAADNGMHASVSPLSEWDEGTWVGPEDAPGRQIIASLGLVLPSYAPPEGE